jgi:hypothetical protein
MESGGDTSWEPAMQAALDEAVKRGNEQLRKFEAANK